VLTWALRRKFLSASLAAAAAFLAAGILLSWPWDCQDAACRVTLLQTFVTIGALILAVPAAIAAWEAYRAAKLKVPIRLYVVRPENPFQHPVRLFFVNDGEGEARGFLVQLVFSRLLYTNEFCSVWPGAEPVLMTEADAEPNLYAVTYVFADPFYPSGPEVLADLDLDQGETLASTKGLTVKWRVRGGNAIPNEGELICLPAYLELT
jgi:hypothetical protein